MTEPPRFTDDDPALDDVREVGALRTPTLARIHLDRLRHNADVFRLSGADLMAVVKADAYGHGASRVAHELADAGIGWFAVATVAEGMRLRRSGLDGRILVFSAPLPQYMSAYAQYDLEVTVSSREVAALIADTDAGLRVHVKVDTGMGRIGISEDDAEGVVALLERAPNTDLAGIWTHLATADEEDLSYAHQQLDRFDEVVRKVGDAAEHIHVANSPAALQLPRTLEYDRCLVRAGIGLYGYTALAGLAERHGLRPAMTMTSRVTHVKDISAGTSISYGRRWTAERPTRVATVGAGYADGYHRRLTNRASVGIRERRYPVVGTVCMDMFMVDVGPDGIVEPNDEVVLFGDGGPNAYELATRAETIPYEILTGISARVPRVYV